MHYADNRQTWRTAFYLGTALIALALHRVADLGLVMAIVLGFAIAAALVRVAYSLLARQQR